MTTKQLQPIKIPSRFDDQVEAEILSFLFDALFEPVIKEMEDTKETFFNSNSVIEDAIRSGKIQFADGIFKGDFNAALTKEFRGLGLKFDKRIKGYRKDLNNLPTSLQIAISQTASKYQQMAAGMINTIDNINFLDKLEELDLSSTYGQVVDNINNQFTQTVTKAVGVSIDLTDNQRDLITKEFSENLKLYIKDFADEQILSLRKDVEKATFAGIRAESLQDAIKDRFNVSKNKARFLARQEISLLTSKYKQAKYQEIGISKYKWSTSGDSRVRDGKPQGEGDHKRLNGKVFSFDDPPITNQFTGARNNPGEDFGCRCVAIPFIEI